MYRKRKALKKAGKLILQLLPHFHEIVVTDIQKAIFECWEALLSEKL